MRVFRDESSLSANPHLWSSIVAAMARSEWFILLLSPESVQSEWVNREVQYWLDHKDPERILPVLTDGDLAWDPTLQRFDPERSNAAPPALIAAFAEEPRWVDLRWARSDTELDLRNTRFRAAVADIASAVRAIPKEDLESEEVLQHRRTVRTAWIAGLVLLLTTAVSIGAALFAAEQRRDAEAQRLVAEEQTQLAQQNETRAEEESERALAAEALARSRELAGSAINVLDRDPELSILLSLAALDQVPEGEDTPVELLSALREAVHSNPILRREQVAEGGFLWLALSPDGTRLLVASEHSGQALMKDTETWETIWTHSDPDSIDTIDAGSFSPDGTLVTVGYIDSTSPFAGYLPPENAPEDDGKPSRLLVLESGTGEAVASIDYPDCPTSVPGPFSPDGRWLALLTASTPVDGYCDGWRVDIIDTTNWTVARTIALPDLTFVEWTPEGELVLDQPGDIIDVETGARVGGSSELVYGASVHPDGTMIAGIVAGGISLYDIDTGRPLDVLHGLDSAPTDLLFSDDGHLLIATTDGGETVAWNIDGSVAHRLPATGPSYEGAYDSGLGRLYLAGTNGLLTVWDISGASGGELDSALSNEGVDWDSLSVIDGRGTYRELTERGGFARAIDLTNGTEILPDAARAAFVPALLTEGRIVVVQAQGSRAEGLLVGPVVVWDPTENAYTELMGCQGDVLAVESGASDVPCTDRQGDFTYYDRPLASPDGSLLAIGSPSSIQIGTIPITAGTEEVLIFDGRTLEQLRHFTVPGLGGMVDLGGDWMVVILESQLKVLSTHDGAILTELGPAVSGFDQPTVEIAPDASHIAIGSSDGSLKLVATESWETVLTIDAHEGRVLGVAFSEDGSHILTTGSEGLIKVWQTSNGAELHRIPLDSVVDGHWQDDQHLLVATETGLWTNITLDLEELVQLAQERLTRGFTPEECSAYRIDNCG